MRKKRVGMTAREEFDKYLAMENCPSDECPFEWWKQHVKDLPNLWKFAREVLGIPATEAGVERLFSSGKRMITDERGSLSGETIQAVQCLKSWLFKSDILKCRKDSNEK